MKLNRMFPKKFLAQVAGAATVGVTEALMENYAPMLFGAKTSNSASNSALLMEPLLPIEQWMVLPVGGLIAFATSRKRVRSENVKAFGEGALLYALPRVVSREIVRAQQASVRNWSPI
jgi:hypothetical protein